ncbi:MAG TPA: helix-turn-helix domain-containing protein [Streptosporangiaceae bacterium]|nr:helix-turn-helix domain-containing protein [Streptosporangiaceae bacterium]
MRSYGHYCAVSKALDVVGDRWTLLIVRELLIGGPSRYTDLRHGLPGIATNLLAGRLADLEQAGVVVRHPAVPPVATPLFDLTARGRALEPALRALGAWGAPLLADAPDSDTAKIHWLALPLRYLLTDHDPTAPPVTVRISAGDGSMLIEADHGTVIVHPGDTDEPHLSLHGSPRLILAVLQGRISASAARSAGLRIDGDETVIDRLRPDIPPPSTARQEADT